MGKEELPLNDRTKLVKLHNAYGKHVVAYRACCYTSVGVCSCGIPLQHDNIPARGKAIPKSAKQTEKAYRTVFARGYDTSYKRAWHIATPDFMANMVDFYTRPRRRREIDDGYSGHIMSVAYGPIMQVVGKMDLSKARQRMLHDMDEDPLAGYVWAVHIDKTASQDIMDALVAACDREIRREDGYTDRRLALIRKNAARALLGIHMRLGVPMDKRRYGLLARRLPMHDRFDLVAYAGKVSKQTLTFGDFGLAYRSYNIAKQSAPEIFGDEQYMRAKLRKHPALAALYLQDTGKDITDHDNYEAFMLKARFIEKRTQPTAEELEQYSDCNLAPMYNDRLKMLANANDTDSMGIALYLANSIDEYIKAMHPQAATAARLVPDSIDQERFFVDDGVEFDPNEDQEDDDD